MNCSNCQTVNPEQARFCMNCGIRLVASGATEMGEVKSAGFNLDRYLPQELLIKLESARTRNSMMGERRVITMLFCDVKGSTAAAEKVDPETWTEIMNGVFEYMIRPIYKYEGLVPRLMGDAILAFFGAPITHEDDPQRAVLAGLEIQEGIRPYVEEIRLKHGLEFGLRVGINTGLVVVGEIGSDLRMEYTAIGDAINLAARMEQTAQVGTIQISEETYKLVAPFFDVQPLGEVEVKGKSAPVKTYRVLSVRSTPGQLRGLEGLTSPLVGRESQLSLLQERLEKLNAGTGSVIAILGEAGLGKSTLVTQLKKSEQSIQYSWLRGDSLSYTRSISYYPWRQILRQSIDAHERDSLEEVRRKLQYTCDCCTLPGGDIAFLEAMLAVESEESSRVVMGLQGEALNQHMIDATRGFLCGLASMGPRVIIFDDLHWSDEASLNLLLNVVDAGRSHPILFLCTSRPEKAASSWETLLNMQKAIADSFYAIELDPLEANQTNRLVENLLGGTSIPKSLRDQIVERAQGNPFFVEELIRSLIETGQMVREDGVWKAVEDEARITLPNTLRGVLSARIDRLPEISKDVLQNAAVIGRSFDLRVLRRLTGLNGGFDPQIRYLNEASMIEPAREEYMFRHVLIQEAAYESILIKRRTELHRRIGESLEELHASRIEEFAPLLAYHFYNAKDERSLKYDAIAGEKAARLYANVEAVAHFRRALEVAGRIQDDKAVIAKLYTQLGQTLELAGLYEQALVAYEELQAFARESGDRSIEMQALMSKATIYSIFSQLHNPSLSEEMLQQALEISYAIGDRATQAKLNWNLMITYLFSKRLDESLRHGELALALARESDDREQLAFVLNDLCRLHTCRGDFDTAHLVIREARELWRSLDNQVMLADSLGSETETYFNAGQYHESLQCSQQALKISEETNNLWGQSYTRMLMSFAYFENGQLGSGIQTAERSAELADRAGLLASSISMRSELAWVYAYCGDFEKGYSLIEQATRVADAKQPAWRAFPIAAKARMHLLQGDLEAARQAVNDSILLPTTIPYARYTIFICLANIELAVAKQEYQQAITMIDELLEEVTPLTRVDIPELLRWKGLACLRLNHIDEAHQALSKADSLARQSDTNLYLWLILMDLAEVQTRMGMQAESESNRDEARRIAGSIADSLHEIGLTDSFLNQPRVRKLMRA